MRQEILELKGIRCVFASDRSYYDSPTGSLTLDSSVCLSGPSWYYWIKRRGNILPQKVFSLLYVTSKSHDLTCLWHLEANESVVSEVAPLV